MVSPAATPSPTIGSGQSPVTRSDSHSESKRRASSPVTSAANRSGSLEARVPSPYPMRTFTAASRQVHPGMSTAPTTIDLTTPFRLDGRVAIVTGASSGLGDRFARVLHAAGATVVAAARRTDRLEALAGELGERLVPMTCDVSVDDDCERLVADAIALDGHLDVLVNNAGIGAPMAAEDEPIDGFREVVDVNLNALFLLTPAGRPPHDRAPVRRDREPGVGARAGGVGADQAGVVLRRRRARW